MFRRFSPPGRAQRLPLFLSAGLGMLGGADPVGELAWLVLLAPAAGAACGARGISIFPFGLAVPGTWFLCLVLADARSPRDLPTPLWAAAGVVGLFALGLALGRLAPARPAALAGSLLLAGCTLAGLSVGLGLSAPEAFLARSHPGLASALLAASPLTFAFDCAGWDWAHTNPDVYARSGVEWFQRRPWPGHLAGPAVLVVGCLLSWFAGFRSRARP